LIRLVLCHMGSCDEQRYAIANDAQEHRNTLGQCVNNANVPTIDRPVASFEHVVRFMHANSSKNMPPISQSGMP